MTTPFIQKISFCITVSDTKVYSIALFKNSHLPTLSSHVVFWLNFYKLPIAKTQRASCFIRLLWYNCLPRMSLAAPHGCQCLLPRFRTITAASAQTRLNRYAFFQPQSGQEYIHSPGLPPAPEMPVSADISSWTGAANHQSILHCGLWNRIDRQAGKKRLPDPRKKDRCK